MMDELQGPRPLRDRVQTDLDSFPGILNPPEVNELYSLSHVLGIH